MSEYKICTVATGTTTTEMLQQLKSIQKHADMVEIRADYLSDISLDVIAQLKSACNLPAIFTLRAVKEGGKSAVKDAQRIDLVAIAAEVGFEYIDIEFGTIELFKSADINLSAKLILSYHNFENTPLLGDLQGIVDSMAKHNPAIVKIATTSATAADNDTLYKLLLANKHKYKMAVMGMGAIGQQTRIIAPLLGSALTFASTDISASAPGQIDVREMLEVFGTLSLSKGAI